jgi:hypothetical protein
MIFRYLFPKMVNINKHCGLSTATLKTNRQIHQEASSVMYGESTFIASVRLNSIWPQSKEWQREPTKNQKSEGYTVRDLSQYSTH